MSELLDLPVKDLMPHPDNPRLWLRDDVVTQIAAEIAQSGFGREHALLVRPFDGGYQIISGHHRAEAAKQCGLDAVPCWVREMDDDEAFMQLVLTNTQSELSPLEEGRHIFQYVKRRNQGLGGGYGALKDDGLRAYARRLNKSAGSLTKRRDAYEVLRSLPTTVSRETVVGDRLSHLYEISKAPPETWEPVCAAMMAAGPNGWSVKDVIRIVDEVKSFDVPGEYRIWMPLPDIIDRYLQDQRFDPIKVEKIVRAADGVLKWITDNGEPLDGDEFTNWLHREGQSAWDSKRIDGWHVDLIGRVRERELAPEIRAGDFRDVLADLPDGSVDLILTDPPYGDDAVPSYEALGEFAARKLKPGGSLICYTGQSILMQVGAALGQHLRYWWTISLDHQHGGQQLPGKWVMIEWKPLVWYVRDQRQGNDYVADKVRGTRPDKEAHEWAQGIGEVFYLIEQLTGPDDLVVDPFAGSGSFGRAALDLGRRFIGADLDPESTTGQVVE